MARRRVARAWGARAGRTVCSLLRACCAVRAASLLASRNNQLPPHLRPEDPPNLSISISGGKETNKDSLSNGE